MSNKCRAYSASKIGLEKPDNRKAFYAGWDAAIEAELREAIEQAENVEPVEVGKEWKPCVKLPVIVHVREQREGETHVSTREGITPARPNDLIMRGVAGEEYPIGRDLFNQTYTFSTTPPKREWQGLTDEEIFDVIRSLCADNETAEMLIELSMDEYRAIEAKLKEKNN